MKYKVLFFLFLCLLFWNMKKPFFIDTKIPIYEGTMPTISTKKEEVTLVMVGDALYHDACYKDGYQADGSYQFYSHLEFIKPFISQFDLAYYNQESILGGVELGLSNYPRFNSPQEVGDAFIDAGFNLVSTANNHSLDKGKEGIVRSVSYFRKQPVLMQGTCDRIACQSVLPIGEKNGITYAFFAYTTSTNGISLSEEEDYLVNLYSFSRAQNDISKVKDLVDVILVSMHWGEEYTAFPNEEERTIARELSSLGVDLVIGSHPHVIQPIEKIQDTLVFYSLGNFISAQTGMDQLVGIAPSLTILKETRGDQSEVSFQNLSISFTYTSYDSNYRHFRVLLFDQIEEPSETFQNLFLKKVELLKTYGVDFQLLHKLDFSS